MMRFTLIKAFVAITFVALACAGMMYRNAGWASGLISLNLLLFTAMALRAIGLRGAERAFALAFAAVGCGYLLLATSTIFSGIRESLFTNYPLAYAARALRIDSSPDSPYLNILRRSTFVITANSNGGSSPIEDDKAVSASAPSDSLEVPPPEYPAAPIEEVILEGTSSTYNPNGPALQLQKFFQIGHCVWSWLFALLAGWFAAWMYGRKSASVREASRPI